MPNTQFTVRISKELKQELVRQAQAKERTLTWLVIHILQQWLDKREKRP